MKGILKLTILLYTVSMGYITKAQQFIGLNTKYAGISQMPANPAHVTSSKNGMEIQLFSLNALAGTNAFAFERGYILKGFNGKAKEGIDYNRDVQVKEKHLWANVELNGPAVSFKYKDVHYFGVYTRVRQLFRGGGINNEEFALIGQPVPEEYYGREVSFNKTGFTTHTFSEIGVTYGRNLVDNNYHILNGGISLKYLMGFVAGSVYSHDLSYTQKNEDSVGSITGDVSVQYTYNAGAYIKGNPQNFLSSWFQRAGRWGLGIDIGGRYEYHPDGNPNKETPYLFSISAAITDIGTIGYVPDTGSGVYNLAITDIDSNVLLKRDYEDPGLYLLRLQADTSVNITNTDLTEKFSVGLPTALRLSGDFNLYNNLNFAVNILLNLKGNSNKIYKPAYVSYINFTPTYGSGQVRLSLPFTVIGYQSFTIGTIFNFGPFYIGSSSVISTFMSSDIRNADIYAGLVLKFKKDLYSRYK